MLRRFRTHRRLTLFALAVGCAGTACMAGQVKPLLYPNLHLQKVGQAQASSDIAYCETLANQYVEQLSAAGKTAGDTVVGGGIGAAVGAVGGAIAGDAGEGAAIGAAAGAGLGLLHGLFEAGEPTPNYKQFVNRCLQKRGYEVYGWSDE